MESAGIRRIIPELLESKKEKLGLLISQAEEAEETLTELCLTLDELTIS